MNVLQEDLHQTVIGKDPKIKILKSQDFTCREEMKTESVRLQWSGLQVVAMMAIDGSTTEDKTRWLE